MKETTPSFVFAGVPVGDTKYRIWLETLKARLASSQIKAAVKVNTAMLEFYWSLGRDIVAMRAESEWGKGLLAKLSADLRKAFPCTTGLSTTNLRFSELWYNFYSSDNSYQLGKNSEDSLEMPEKFGFVPWRHHVEIVRKCECVPEALFYIDKIVEGNWSRRRLENEIVSDLYRRQGKAVTNFGQCSDFPQRQLAEELLKDPYKLDFLSLSKDYTERELEDTLIHNISRFLLELGKGFAFIGRQVELRMPDGQSFFPDMIFYHTKLKCYVVIELKVVDFIPEFAGKLNFYVSAADHLLRASDDNPTIGLLICKAKDETIVKWSFQDMAKPLGVATYELGEVFRRTLEDKLPSVEEIEQVIR